jgi:hypothetical protein
MNILAGRLWFWFLIVLLEFFIGVILDIWEPQPLWSIRAYPGLQWDCFYLIIKSWPDLWNFILLNLKEISKRHACTINLRLRCIQDNTLMGPKEEEEETCFLLYDIVSKKIYQFKIPIFCWLHWVLKSSTNGLNCICLWLNFLGH